MINTLNESVSLTQYILNLANFYELQKCKPSKMILIILLGALTKYVKLTNDEKNMVLQSGTLLDFLLFFAHLYDEQNATLFPKHKEELNNKIEFLLKTTRCNKIK